MPSHVDRAGRYLLTWTALYTIAFLLAVGRLTGLLGPAGFACVSWALSSGPPSVELFVAAKNASAAPPDVDVPEALTSEAARAIAGCPPEAFRSDAEELAFAGDGLGSDEAGLKPEGGGMAIAASALVP